MQQQQRYLQAQQDGGGAVAGLAVVEQRDVPHRVQDGQELDQRARALRKLHLHHDATTCARSGPATPGVRMIRQHDAHGKCTKAPGGQPWHLLLTRSIRKRSRYRNVLTCNK